MTARGNKTPVGDETAVLDLVVNGSTLTGSQSDVDHHSAPIGHGKVAGNTLE